MTTSAQQPPCDYVCHCLLTHLLPAFAGMNLTTDHFLTCNLLFRRSSTTRHDELLKLLVKFLHDSGLQPVPEAASNGLRPDVRLYCISTANSSCSMSLSPIPRLPPPS